MIVLDTNVLSEPTKPAANATVVQWLNDQRRSELFTIAIILGETLQGIASMVEGVRRQQLEFRVHELTQRFLITPVPPFDEAAAVALAEITKRARAKPYTIGVADAQIAAIALARGGTVATRDVEPFLVAGLPVINPWVE